MKKVSIRRNGGKGGSKESGGEGTREQSDLSRVQGRGRETLEEGTLKSTKEGRKAPIRQASLKVHSPREKTNKRRNRE